MVRFIFITFGLLGYTFYEMSGGADFEPTASAARVAEIRMETLRDSTGTTEIATGQIAPASDIEVTRVSLNLTDIDSVGQPVKPVSEQQPEADVQVASLVQAGQGASVAIIPSLVRGADPVEAEPAAVVTVEEAPKDLRRVSGNRVNVRAGPGTSYGVVNRLVRGDEVEILEDDGNGWVRLRAGDGQVGWMADFLLSKG